MGLNCALGAADMQPYVANLAKCADCYVFAYPNAGLPNAMGGYDQKDHEMAAGACSAASHAISVGRMLSSAIHVNGSETHLLTNAYVTAPDCLPDHCALCAEVKPFVEEGLVNALGGCCGSRPDHIAAIVKMASGCAFLHL